MDSSVRPFIVGIGGTTQAASSPEKALQYALALAKLRGAQTKLFDGPSVHLPMYAPGLSERSAEAQRLIAALRRANGIILSTPCYHGSVSGLLKNALDYVEDMAKDAQPYFDGRSVGLIVCGYGWQSTAMTLNALRSMVHALRGWPTPMGIAINTASTTERPFDDEGAVTDEAAARQMGIMVNQVVDFARMQMAQAAHVE